MYVRLIYYLVIFLFREPRKWSRRKLPFLFKYYMGLFTNPKCITIVVYSKKPPMGTNEHYLGILDDKTLDRIYSDTVENLRAHVVNKFGSIAKCAKAIGVDRANLTKHINGTNQLSIGMYLRICIALGILSPAVINPKILDQKTGLKDHLAMFPDPLFASILWIDFN